jgi:hypothetical protein
MRAVQSTGSGKSARILPKVGKTPADLIAWLTSDHDFEIVSRPKPSTLVHGVRTTHIVVGVSTSARYGDPACPANPRCADLFIRPHYWGTEAYGIGGKEQTQLFIGEIKQAGKRHNFIVALDAEGPSQMRRLTSMARPIIASMRLPKGIGGR